jgi:hypothetical protein
MKCRYREKKEKEKVHVFKDLTENNNYSYLFILNNNYFNHYSTLIFITQIILHNFSYHQSFATILFHEKIISYNSHINMILNTI